MLVVSVFCMDTDTLEYDTIHNVDHHVMHPQLGNGGFFFDDVEECIVL